MDAGLYNAPQSTRNSYPSISHTHTNPCIVPLLSFVMRGRIAYRLGRWNVRMGQDVVHAKIATETERTPRKESKISSLRSFRILCGLCANAVRSREPTSGTGKRA